MPIQPTLRPATLADVPAMTALYAHHVRHGSASFETEAPDEAEIARRHAALTTSGMPWLVLEQDGVLLGYAYAGPYRPRPAYRNTVENSVYVHADRAGLGHGRRLLEGLIARCTEMGLRQMVAVVGDSGNAASLALHHALGFAEIGVLRNVGFKHGRWLDIVLLQRALGAGESLPPANRG